MTRVWIIGLGAQTTVGRTATFAAAAVRAGIIRVAEHPFALDRTNEPLYVSKANYIHESEPMLERLIMLALPAIRDALSPLSALQDKPELPLFVGLPEPAVELTGDFQKALMDELSVAIQAHAQILSKQVIETGHCAGLMAIEQAFNNISSGTCELCLAGGVHSYLDPKMLHYLMEKDILYSETNKHGFMPGEAAGFCLLASDRMAAYLNQHFQVPWLGRIVSAHTTIEKNTIRGNTVCTGEGLTASWKAVLEPLSAESIQIDQIFCDMNGEPYRSSEFGYSILRTLGYFKDPESFVTPAINWGDVGAASGPLFVSLAVAARLRNYGPGPYSLVWTSSETGHRSASVIDTSAVNIQASAFGVLPVR